MVKIKIVIQASDEQGNLLSDAHAEAGVEHVIDVTEQAQQWLVASLFEMNKEILNQGGTLH